MNKNQSITKKITVLSSIVIGCSIITPANPTLANPIIEIFEDRFIDRDYDRFDRGDGCKTLPYHHKLRGKVGQKRVRRWREHGHRRCIKHRGDDRYHRHDNRGWIPYKNWDERYSDRYRYWGNERDWRYDWRDEKDESDWRGRHRRDRNRRYGEWKDRRDDWKDKNRNRRYGEWKDDDD